MKGIMDGIRVVELASWTYVPVAGAVLAEWGADVIKIEHPESGDPQRGLAAMGLIPTGPGGVAHMMELPNRGKRSVGLDIRSQEGHDLLLKMCEHADVFLTNWRPQARTKYRVDVEDVRAVNPDIIYVRGSGQGQRGPEAERGGYDGCTFWGRGGPADIISNPDDYPIMQPGPAFGDVIGGLTIAGGISAALFHRQRTGEALVVDNSLLATAMWATGASIIAAGLFGFNRMPRGNRKKVPNPIVGTYRTKDNRYLSLVMLESDRYWGDLVTRMGRPELADDPRFVDAAARAQNSEECVTTLDEIFATRTVEEWREALAEAAGVWAVVQTAAELLEDPMALANGYLQEVEAKSGTTYRIVASPLQFDETPPDLTRGPDHGEHTDEVLLEMGLDMDAIMDLKIKGAVL
ncbi:MAG TPA: CoA transferase [Acidimicrobiales bacterium]|nr:CoA transferase [Acidimicrobiales bacterium]